MGRSLKFCLCAAPGVGVVTTGSEVFYGRIQDAFGPVLRKKFVALGSTVVGQTLTSDEVPMTAGAIRDFLEQGADFIVVTGGMSVDPDDRTPTAIRASGAEVVSYGAPVYPGAMFLLAYAQGAAGRCPCWGCPDASCTTRPAFLISLCRACWPALR